MKEALQPLAAAAQGDGRVLLFGVDELLDRDDLFDRGSLRHNCRVADRLRAGEQHRVGVAGTTGDEHRLEMRLEIRQIPDVIRPGYRAIVTEREPAVESRLRQGTAQRFRPAPQLTIRNRRVRPHAHRDLRAGCVAAAARLLARPAGEATFPALIAAAKALRTYTTQ